jgi:hypothetical protein
MANVKLIFSGTEKSESNEYELCCFLNTNNEIYIELDCKVFPTHFICLDKSTAIKFAKTLRTEINKIED